MKTICSGDRWKECQEIEIEHRHGGSKVLCDCVFLKDGMKAVSKKHLQKHSNACIASSCLKRKTKQKNPWTQSFVQEKVAANLFH